MNIQQQFIQFIKGDTLLNEEAFKRWKLILFILGLLLLMIYSGHQVDNKVMKIAKLKKQENEYRAHYIALRSKSMKLKMETTIIDKLKDTGLHPADKPAQVIEERSE